MSFLVAIARSAYRADALNDFQPTSAFSLRNAQAMMWMSQLAYETENEQKIESVLGDWSLAIRGFASNDPDTGWPPKSACLVGAGGRGGTIIAFAGSDPLKIEDWITDFDAAPSPDDVHTGFREAVANVWPEIKRVIDARPASEQPLFFTGHSLGGALANRRGGARAKRGEGRRHRGLYFRQSTNRRAWVFCQLSTEPCQLNIPSRGRHRRGTDRPATFGEHISSCRTDDPMSD
jgi:hypothetical protein